MFGDLFGEEAFGKLKLLQVRIEERDGERLRAALRCPSDGVGV